MSQETPWKPPPLGPAISQRFALLELLGSGGSGAVYRATEHRLGRDVALKLLQAPLLTDPDQIRRFVNEARITAALSDPHIVKVLDCGADDGVPWIAYELIRGPTVRERIARGPLDPERAIALGLQLCQALQEAHGRGILHRDVKSENVFEAGERFYKLGDFGIAKWSHSRAVQTRAGLLLGTPAYLAPEYIEGSPATRQSDLYAVGVLLFYALVGRLPFEADRVVELMEQHLRAPVPHPIEQRPDIGLALDRLVVRALQKDPAHRYSGAEELHSELAGIGSSDRWRGAATQVALPVDPGQARRVGGNPVRATSGQPATAPMAARGRRSVPIALVFLLVLAAVSWRRRPTGPVDRPVPPGSPAPSIREIADATARPDLDPLTALQTARKIGASLREFGDDPRWKDGKDAGLLLGGRQALEAVEVHVGRHSDEIARLVRNGDSGGQLNCQTWLEIELLLQEIPVWLRLIGSHGAPGWVKQPVAVLERAILPPGFDESSFPPCRRVLAVYFRACILPVKGSVIHLLTAEDRERRALAHIQCIELLETVPRDGDSWRHLIASRYAHAHAAIDELEWMGKESPRARGDQMLLFKTRKRLLDVADDYLNGLPASNENPRGNQDLAFCLVTCHELCRSQAGRSDVSTRALRQALRLRELAFPVSDRLQGGDARTIEALAWLDRLAPQVPESGATGSRPHR